MTSSNVSHFEVKFIEFKSAACGLLQMESEKPLHNWRSSKDNSKSDEIRREANARLAEKTKKSYSIALHGYNKCICFAESGSEQLAFGYANRSAAYIGLHMYKECLANIELARNVEHYPASLNSQLEQREAICHKELQTIVKDMTAVTPKLSYPAHEKLPFVANCVDIHRDAKYGRHLVVNSDVNVGDVIAIEKPFCTVNSAINRYKRCENCTQEHHYSLIPCEQCTGVMFCSVECRDEAMQSFHKYECATIDFIHSECHTTVEMTCIRLVTTALAIFDGDTEALYKYADQVDINEGTTVFDIDYSQTLTAVDKFAPAYCMINELEEKYPAPPPMQTINMILYHAKLISRADGNDEQAHRHVRKIAQHFWTSRAPSSDIKGAKDLVLNNRHVKLNLVYRDGSRGVYPFEYLFNHSCVPNVQVAAYGSERVLTICRPVKAGQQLFISYGYVVTEHSHCSIHFE